MLLKFRVSTLPRINHAAARLSRPLPTQHAAGHAYELRGRGGGQVASACSIVMLKPIQPASSPS